MHLNFLFYYIHFFLIYIPPPLFFFYVCPLNRLQPAVGLKMFHENKMKIKRNKYLKNFKFGVTEHIFGGVGQSWLCGAMRVWIEARRALGSCRCGSNGAAKRKKKKTDSAKRKIKNDLGLILHAPPQKTLYRYAPHNYGYFFCAIYLSLAHVYRRISALVVK